MQVPGIQQPITLPDSLAALAGQDVVLLDRLPARWAQALWGESVESVKAGDLIDFEDQQHLIAQFPHSRELGQRAITKAAADQLRACHRVPVGWNVGGPGDLTDIMLGWAAEIAKLLRQGFAGQKAAIVSLGGVGGTRSTRLRYVDVLAHLRAIPWRAGGSVHGRPVSKAVMQGLALIGVALNTERPQALIRQAVEEELDVTGGEVTTSGWSQFFRPLSNFGEFSAFTETNVARFTGHVTLRWGKGAHPVLEVLMASTATKAIAVEADLRAGICHIPHDQLKNASLGQGTRATWLVDGEIRSLPGANSKPEKFLNRNKLIAGTAASLLNPVDSALRIIQD